MRLCNNKKGDICNRNVVIYDCNGAICESQLLAHLTVQPRTMPSSKDQYTKSYRINVHLLPQTLYTVAVSPAKLVDHTVISANIQTRGSMVKYTRYGNIHNNSRGSSYNVTLAISLSPTDVAKAITHKHCKLLKILIFYCGLISCCEEDH